MLSAFRLCAWMKYLETSSDWRTPLIQTLLERGREEGVRPGRDETSAEERMIFSRCTEIPEEKINPQIKTPHTHFSIPVLKAPSLAPGPALPLLSQSPGPCQW